MCNEDHFYVGNWQSPAPWMPFDNEREIHLCLVCNKPIHRHEIGIGKRFFHQECYDRHEKENAS